MVTITPTDLPPELQASLSRRALNSGEILLQQGETATHLFMVVTGQIRLVSFVNQRMVTHYFVEAGELLGESALYIDTYGCTAIAETPAEVIALPVAAFAAALRQDAHLAERYLANLTHRFATVKALLELRSISSARDRLLHYLMQRRVPGHATVILDKPLRTIASELALTPEALSRLLTRLQTEGVISRKKRSITFSEDWLADMAE